jgi:ferrous iron transport protein A
VTLADLEIGIPARVTRVGSEHPRADTGILYRLMEMGLIAGAEVEVRKVAPFGDPLELKVRGYSLSIRRAEARFFSVERR